MSVSKLMEYFCKIRFFFPSIFCLAPSGSVWNFACTARSLACVCVCICACSKCIFFLSSSFRHLRNWARCQTQRTECVLFLWFCIFFSFLSFSYWNLYTLFSCCVQLLSEKNFCFCDNSSFWQLLLLRLLLLLVVLLAFSCFYFFCTAQMSKRRMDEWNYAQRDFFFFGPKFYLEWIGFGIDFHTTSYDLVLNSVSHSRRTRNTLHINTSGHEINFF